MKPANKTLVCLVLSLLFVFQTALAEEYIFPKSNKELLTYQQVWEWQYDVLGYAFNELFARHGRPFEKNGKYDLYFQQRNWYAVDPNYPGDGKVLNETEWMNYSLIKQVRSEMRAMNTINPDGKSLPYKVDNAINIVILEDGKNVAGSDQVDNSIIGTWVRTEEGIQITVIFQKNGVVCFESLGISFTGKYETKGGILTLSFNEDLENQGLLSGSVSYSISGNILDMNGVELTKSQ